MIDKYTAAINAGLALILTLSPGFFKTNGTSLTEVKGIYAQAQKRAEYIVATGDVSELQNADAALQEVQKYQKYMDKAGPLVKALQKKFLPGPDLTSLTYENVDSLMPVDADAVAALEAEMSLTSE